MYGGLKRSSSYLVVRKSQMTTSVIAHFQLPLFLNSETKEEKKEISNHYISPLS